METCELVEIALRAGELLLKSGAEVYRVEDTIIRIFKAYDRQCECFVILGGIFIYAKENNNKSITIIKRIKGLTFDLNRIDLVNEFSRGLYKNQVTYTQAIKILENIEKVPLYNYSVRILAAGLTAYVYTLIFKGNFYEASIALPIAVLVYIINEKMYEIGFFDFIIFFISGLVVAGASLGAVKLFPSLNIYKIIMGGVIILLPGISITGGIKDALHGDIVSSLYRLIEALFIFVGIGAGVALVLSIGL